MAERQTVGYTRLSLDASGQGLAVARQREDIDQKATALGWPEVSHYYEDNDITADPKKKVRPAFQALLADMAAGRVKRVLCYDQDRLVRDMRELEDIVDAVEAGNVYLTSVNGDIDLLTDNGKMVARIKAAVARNELEKIARRTKRQKQQMVEAGKPLGQRFRTFGYSRDWKVIEGEAAIVREVFDRFAAGESQNGITKDLQARGIKTASGGDWTPLQTSRMLKTPKYAGFQTYKGEVVGKSTVVPPLVSEGIYETVQKPAVASATNARKHLLSGLLICDSCKAPMTGTRVVVKGKESARYRCEVRSGGCGSVSIKAEWIEGMVNRYMSFWVSNEYMKRLQAQPEPENNDAAIEEVDRRIRSIQRAMGDGSMDVGDGIAALKVARTERIQLVKKDAAQSKAEVDYRLAISDYDSATPDQQRVEIRKAFKFIFVMPGRRVRHFDDRRIKVLMTFDDRIMPGGAVNVVDYRDEPGEGSRALYDDHIFDPARGW